MLNRPTPKQLAPVEELRRRIQQLQHQIGEALALPPDAAEIERRAQLLAQQCDIGEMRRNQLRQHLLSGRFSANGAREVLDMLTGPQVLALVLPGALVASLTELAGKIGGGVSTEDREQRLAQLRAEMDAAEREEERLLSDLEDAGLTVRRRQDARPEIVLGL